MRYCALALFCPPPNSLDGRWRQFECSLASVPNALNDGLCIYMGIGSHCSHAQAGSPMVVIVWAEIPVAYYVWLLKHRSPFFLGWIPRHVPDKIWRQLSFFELADLGAFRERRVRAGSLCVKQRFSDPIVIVQIIRCVRIIVWLNVKQRTVSWIINKPSKHRSQSFASNK